MRKDVHGSQSIKNSLGSDGCYLWVAVFAASFTFSAIHFGPHGSEPYSLGSLSWSADSLDQPFWVTSSTPI